MARTAIVRSQTPMTLTQIHQAAPSVFADHKRGDRSERYTFIPTSAVLDRLLTEGFSVFAAGQTITRRTIGEYVLGEEPGNKLFAKHILRLRKNDGKTLRKVGDEFPEVVLTNSHDGTSAFQLVGGIYRLICSNGMVVGRDQGEVKVRHSGDVVDNVIEGSFRVVDDLKQIGERVEAYSNIYINQREQLLLADAAITARWGDNKPVEAAAINAPRRYQDRGSDLWTTFNRIQENVTKGGQAGRSASGRRLTTRAVNSVSVDTNLNRALFTLADEFAKLKVAS